MTLQIKTEDGFIMLDSSSIKRFTYSRKYGKDQCVLVSTDGGEFRISVDQLSEMADTGFELAKECVAVAIADRMVNGEPQDEAYKHLEDMANLFKTKPLLTDWYGAGGAGGTGTFTIETTLGANTTKTIG